MTAAHLPSRLVLIDGQQGFVGETGTITTIEQDGTFTVAEFVRDLVQPPSRTGRLSEDALGRLARTLEAELTAKLPDRLGDAGTANPRRLRLRYGSSDTTLLLPAGSRPEAAGELAGGAGAPGGRVLRVWSVAEELVAGA